MKCAKCKVMEATEKITWKERGKTAKKINLCKNCLYEFEGRNEQGFKRCSFDKFFGELIRLEGEK